VLYEGLYEISKLLLAEEDAERTAGLPEGA
jgi:hypothetical protein